MTGIAVPISSGPEVRDFPDVTYNLARNEYMAVWDVDMGRDGMDLDVYEPDRLGWGSRFGG